MGNSCTPGHLCQEEKPVFIDPGTSCLANSKPAGPERSYDDVSMEIGACFLPVNTRICGLNAAEMQVLAWLRENRNDIAGAEKTFRVDRRAIAGAIAWEMLENVRTKQGIWVGPGKMHLRDMNANHPVASIFKLVVNSVLQDPGKGTLAEEVENNGVLPKHSYEERAKILATPQGAITYIAAVMSEFARIAEDKTGVKLRGNPVILTSAYQSRTLETWTEIVSKKAAGSKFSGGNPMDIWVGTHLDFLADGVGQPELAPSDMR